MTLLGSGKTLGTRMSANVSLGSGSEVHSLFGTSGSVRIAALGVASQVCQVPTFRDVGSISQKVVCGRPSTQNLDSFGTGIRAAFMTEPKWTSAPDVFVGVPTLTATSLLPKK